MAKSRKVTVYSPVEDFTGVVAGVEFAKGKGETDNPSAVNYFRRQGYGIGSRPKPKTPPERRQTATHAQVGTPLADASTSEGATTPGTGESDQSPERPSDKDKKDVWVDHATSLGIDTDGLTKAQLIEAVDNR